MAYQIVTAALIDFTIHGHYYATIYINIDNKQMAYDVLNLRDALQTLKINTIVIQFNKNEYHLKFQYTNIDIKPSHDHDKIKNHKDVLAIRLDTKDELICFLIIFIYDEHYIAIYDNSNQSY